MPYRHATPAGGAAVGTSRSATGPSPLEPLLEWADRNVRDRGLGDMPYPPDHAKMAGAPKHVQLGKARRT